MKCRFYKRVLFFVGLLIVAADVAGQQSDSAGFTGLEWGPPIEVKSYRPNSSPSFKQGHTTKTGLDAGNESPDSSYGSQYCRLLPLGKDKWLSVYTVRTHKGYQEDPQGGLRLEIAKSTDNGQSWNVIARLKDPGRDLDNGQLIRLRNGHILLASRSVRWQSSYRLPVFESMDGGFSWRYLSLIDANEGPEGSLGHPDKGVYEPHFILLKNDRLAVFYANEKHVTELPSFSQVISEKISRDDGHTWEKEILVAHDPKNKDARPGMPVCTKMKNGAYILVYEVCGTKGCNIYQKESSDGIEWRTGIGTPIPDQAGAPFVLSMSDGRLIVTSNKGNISLSHNYGQTWYPVTRPWRFLKSYDEDWQQALWPSLYQFGRNKIGVTAALNESDGHTGHHVTLRFGELK